MGHVTRYGIKVDTSDFRKFWHGTVAYNRDGCSSIYIIPFHKGKCTDSVIKRFFKQIFLNLQLESVKKQTKQFVNP